jgi:hypothetical protein
LVRRVRRGHVGCALDDLGYRCADMPFERTSSAPATCSSNQVLDAMRSGVEAQANAGAEGEAVATQLILACQGLCLPWTWTSAGPTAWSACTYGAWALAGTGCPPVTPLERECVYSCSCTQTRTRTRTHRYADCTRGTCSQTQTQTCTLNESCRILCVETCPTTPSASCASQFGTATPTCSAGAWGPPCSW